MPEPVPAALSKLQQTLAASGPVASSLVAVWSSYLAVTTQLHVDLALSDDLASMELGLKAANEQLGQLILVADQMRKVNAAVAAELAELNKEVTE